MTARSIESYYPLTPVQQGMLFHCLQRPGEGEYWQQLIVHLAGHIDRQLLSRALSLVADRHAALRTSLLWEGVPQPIQTVHTRTEVPLTVHDWRSDNEDQRQHKLAKLLENDRITDCNLSAVPLWRLHLIQWQSAEDWRLIWGHHHVLLDGWSLPIVVSDLLTYYRSLVTGVSPDLPAVRPYRDYVAYLKSRDSSDDEQFWKRLLAGYERATPIGFARSSPAETTSGQAVVQVDFTEQETAAVMARARAARLTINTLIQASWAVVLGRYAGDNQVILGVVTAGRPPELQGMDSIVGLFVNTVPFPVKLDPSLKIADWLKSIQYQMIDVQAHDLTPLVDIARWSEVPRNESLFESILVFGSSRLSSAASDDIIRVVKVDAVERTHYPLTVLARVMPDLSFRVRYNRTLFDEQAVIQAVRRTKLVLCQIAERPEDAVADISVCSPDERRKVLTSWNTTAADFPQDMTVSSLVESRVSRWPQRIAVQHGREQVTYQQLDQRSNQLAQRLIKLGARGRVVAVSVPRSIDLVTTLWAILKAGACYLPLDPDWPTERLKFMLDQAEAKAAVVSGNVPAVLSGFGVLDLAEHKQSLADESADRLDPIAGPEDLCYVMFTSGSTGRPKGVAMPHRPLVNLLHWQETASGLPQSTATLQYTSVGFDVSCQEIFATLATGGRLVMINEHDRRDPAGILQLIAQYQVDRLFVPFVTLDAMATVAGAGVPVPGSLRQIITAGEQLKITPAIVRLFSALPECVLQNQYGPAETHVVTAHTLTGSPASWPLLPPIGKPISNVQTVIVDAAGQPVPPGVIGELLIGGQAVARGYIGAPDLTRERFVPACFDVSSGVMYRTGDNCRWTVQGEIEFVGRSDHQVKIRGYRVEPGEVEAAMGSINGVKAAVAVVDTTDSGTRRLLGYCVIEPEGSVTADEIKARLREIVPDYMAPSVIICLSELPLTASGKVDRRRLPVPLMVGASRGGKPTSDLQRQIADIWRELLAVDAVGLDDNFFDLGGQSLLAVQVYSRLRAITDKELSIIDLFEHSTVRELADFLGDTAGDDAGADSSAQRAETRRKALTRVRRRTQGEAGEHGG